MMRLDAAIRIDATCDVFRATALGALHQIWLTHGLYLSAEDLAAHIEARLVDIIDPAATVTVTDGFFAIAWPTGDVSLVWDLPTLRDWLGYEADATNEVSPVAAPNRCQGVFLPSTPWSSLSPISWSLHLARAPTWRGQGVAILRGLHRTWSVTARATTAELAQLRLVLGQLLAGLPGRLFLDADTLSAWTATNAAGYVDVCLAGDREYVERWMTSPARLALELDLELAEYVP